MGRTSPWRGDKPFMLSVSRISSRKRVKGKIYESVEYKMTAPPAEKVLVIPLASLGEPDPYSGMYERAYLLLTNPDTELVEALARDNVVYTVDLRKYVRTTAYKVEPPRVLLYLRNGGISKSIESLKREFSGCTLRMTIRPDWVVVVEILPGQERVYASKGEAEKALRAMNEEVAKIYERVRKRFREVELVRGRIVQETVLVEED